MAAGGGPTIVRGAGLGAAAPSDSNYHNHDGDSVMIRLGRLALVFWAATFASARADSPPLGPQQVAALLALNQQLADIDQFTVSQFKQSAWERAGEGLARVLTAPETVPDF